MALAACCYRSSPTHRISPKLDLLFSSTTIAGSACRRTRLDRKSILTQRVRMEGFIVADRLDLWPRALTEIADWYSKGLLKQGRETVAQGIEAAPEAFIGLFRGDNFSKQLVGLV
jgi:NADPH-dependent curcumin reductase CurA